MGSKSLETGKVAKQVSVKSKPTKSFRIIYSCKDDFYQHLKYIVGGLIFNIWFRVLLWEIYIWSSWLNNIIIKNSIHLIIIEAFHNILGSTLLYLYCILYLKNIFTLGNQPFSIFVLNFLYIHRGSVCPLLKLPCVFLQKISSAFFFSSGFYSKSQ